MRQSWDLRAQDNPLVANDPGGEHVSFAEFYLRGQELAESLLAEAARRLGTEARAGRVLDIGCGMGRLFGGLAKHFDEIIGLDVSPRMLELGRVHCPVEATFVLGDGVSFAGVPAGGFDHVLAVDVLSRVPEPFVVEAYVQGLAGVLRPGGTFQIQLRRGSETFGETVARHLPGQARAAYGAALRYLGALPFRGDADTWFGCVFPPGDAWRLAAGAGLAELHVVDDAHDDATTYWLMGRRQAKDED